MRRSTTARLAAARVVAAVLGVVLALTAGGGCGGAPATVDGLRFMVPNTPGSGYDLTARTATRAMEDAGLARGVEVFNVPGAGGTVGLQRVVNERGNGKLLMQMGLGVVGASYADGSAVTLRDTTPIAKLVEEPEAVVVPASSPYSTLDQLVQAWRANPVAVAVGGGSSPGGPDHLAAHLMAEAVGVDPTAVTYIGYDGGGRFLTALLNNQIAFGVSGAGEFVDLIEDGLVRVLAVTGAERVALLGAPTLRESGVDLVFTNWRGVVAPPGISDADRQALVELVDGMHASPQWKDAAARNNFVDAYLPADRFAAFLQEENDRVARVLGELELAPRR
jgi:putative tricarboxylic transport membrane protein